MVPFPGSRARKLAPPRRFQATKTIFEVLQSQRYIFLASKTPLVDVQRLFLVIFGCVKGFLGLSKTWIPYSTSIKNQVFKISTCKTPLGRLLEAFWSLWERPLSLSWKPLGGPLANLTGGPVNKIQFFPVSRGVWACSALWMASGDAFG